MTTIGRQRQMRRERLAAIAAARALAAFMPRWHVEDTGLGQWTATRRTTGGHHHRVRCITAPTPAELAVALATADAEEDTHDRP